MSCEGFLCPCTPLPLSISQGSVGPHQHKESLAARYRVKSCWVLSGNCSVDKFLGQGDSKEMSLSQGSE